MIDISIPSNDNKSPAVGPEERMVTRNEPMPETPAITPVEPAEPKRDLPEHVDYVHSVITEVGLRANERAESFEARMNRRFPGPEAVVFSLRGTQPEQAYRNVQLATQTGLSQQYVAADPEGVQEDLQARRSQDALTGFPDVIHWAQENPESAKVAQEDWANFTLIEANMRAWSDVYKAIGDASDNLSVGWQSGALVAKTGEAFYRNPTTPYAQNLSRRYDEFHNGLSEEQQDSVFFTIGQIVGTMAYSGDSMTRGAAMAAIPLSAGFAALGAVGVATAPLATPAMALIATSAVFESTREIEAGMFIREAMQRGIKVEDARAYAEVVGAINGALEAGSDIVMGAVFGKMLKPVFKDVVNKTVLKRLMPEFGLAEGLQRPTRAAVIRNTTFGVAGNATTEATTESLQDIVNSYAENVLNVAQGLQERNELHTEAGRQQLLDEVSKSWWQVWKASALLGGAFATVGLPSNLRRAQDASVAQMDFVHALNEAGQSPTAQNYPEVMKQFQESELQRGGISQVYVDNAAFAQAMTEANVTLDQLAQANPDLAADVQKAINEGSDVVISSKDFVNTIVGTDLGAHLEPDVRLTEEGLSARELASRQQQAEAIFQQALKATDNPEVESALMQFKAEVDEIGATVEEQLKATGKKAREAKDGATLIRKFFETQATRLGISPKALYEMLPISVVNDEATTGFKQPDAKLIAMQKRSYAFDEQLRQWEQGKGEAKFDLGAPSWVLQIFGVDPSVPVTASKAQFVHVQFAPDAEIDLNGRTVSGKHRMPSDELRGLLVAIQRPLAVFESTRSTPESRSIVLLTELTHQGKKGQQSIIAPVRLTVMDNGQTVTVNEIKTIHGKRKLPKSWLENGLLLGYEKTKGLEAVQQFHRSTSSTAGSNPSGNRSDAPVPFVSDAIVYENDTSVEDLYQGNRGTYSPASLTIQLTAKADASTFLHETGHFFLDATMRLAQHPNATPQMLQDAQTLLEWFGVESVEAWNALGVEGQRPYHEQFAYNYERYLFEGEAPTGRLKALFSRFTEWLKSAYKDLMGETNAIYRQQFGRDLPQLSDGVRQVMDRLIASDEAVQKAVLTRQVEPLIMQRDRGGMTEEEWAEYINSPNEGLEQAKTLLRIRTLRDSRALVSRVAEERKKAEAKAKNKRDELRKKFEEEVRLEPFYQAKHFLQTGEMLNDRGEMAVPEPYADHKLKAEENVLKNRRITNLTSREGGVTADWVASQFNLGMDGRQFVNELIARPNFNEAVNERVEQAMMEEFSFLEDESYISAQVAEAISNEAYGRMIASEYKVLAKASQPARLLREYAKAAAETIIAKTPFVRINQSRYIRSEGKARRLAQQATARGDIVKAQEYKRQELLNHELARLATDVDTLKRRIVKMRREAFRPNAKLTKTRDMNHVGIVRAILAEFGMATDTQSKTTDSAIKTLKELEPDVAESLETIVGGVRDTVGNRRGDRLTFNDVRSIVETLEAEWRLSRTTKLNLIEGERVEREILERELVEQASKEFSKSRRLSLTQVPKGNETLVWKFQSMLLGWNASMRRMESWCKSMDGGKEGAFTKYLFQPINDATTEFRKHKLEAFTTLASIVRGLYLDDRLYNAPELDSEVFVKNFHGKITKAQILHAILHTGNASNKKKLLLGYGWGRTIRDPITGEEHLDSSRWDAFINRMAKEGIVTKADFDMIQKIWDLFETIKKPAQNAFYEIYGYHFKEVDAEPVVTPFGIYKGGYAPAIVDSNLVNTAERKSAKEQLEVVADSFMMPQAPNGFTKERVENYAKPLLLDLRLIPGHIDKVLRFAYIAPRVREVYRLLGASRSPLTKLINEYDSHIVESMVIPWLNRAQGQYVSKPSDTVKISKWFDEAYRGLRTNVSMGAMAGNVGNTLQQYTGLSIALNRVSAKSLRMAMREQITSPREALRFVITESEWMRQRLSSNLFELAGEIEDLILAKNKYREAKNWTMRYAYFMQQFAQNTIDVPVWLAAYRDAIQEGKTQRQAVQHADAVIRETQGSFNPEDLSRIEAGTPFHRLFTMFYSYFNMQYNLLATDVGQAWMNRKMGRAAFTFTTTMLIPSAVSRLIMSALGGFDTGDDDEFDSWDFMRMVGNEVGANFTAMIPGAGPVINYWLGIGSMNRLSVSPVFSAAETIKGVNEWFAPLTEDDDFNARRAVRATITAIGVFTGWPVGQLAKPLGYTAGVLNDDITPENISDIVRGLISGRDVNQ